MDPSQTTALDRFRSLFAETPYSPAEERAHSVTHGLGAIAAVVGLLVLLEGLSDATPADLAAVTVYALSLIVLFGSSALYHGLPEGRGKQIALTVDHCAIYLLIAGTVTPFALIGFTSISGQTLTLTVWLLAGLGIVLKVAAGRSTRLEAIEPWIAIPLYLGMGWMGLFWGEGGLTNLPDKALFWLVTGGALYSFGVLIYLLRVLPYNHTLWHLFVLAAAAAHFHAIYSHILPLA